MLLSLVVLPGNAEAHHTLWLCEPLEHGNELGALLDSWLKGLKDLLNSLIAYAKCEQEGQLSLQREPGLPQEVNFPAALRT